MKPTAPTISVIIIAYNSGAGRLARCVRSVQTQSLQPTQIIVYDNASEDGCTDGLGDLPGVTVIRSDTNTGFAGGVNRAASKAQGDWLALLNPDAVAEDDWLDRLAAGQKRWPDDDLFASVQLMADTPTMLDGLGDVYHATGVAFRGGYGSPASTRPAQDRAVFAACGAALFVRTRTFRDLGGFAEDFFCYHEDVDFGFRLRLAGGRCILLHDAVIHHEGSGTTGRYSSFTVYHGVRNRLWTFVRCMPPALFWLLLPAHLIVSMLFILRSAFNGTATAYTRGIVSGLRGLPSHWTTRRQLMKNRKASTAQIATALSWSPLALLRRGADLRQITPHRQHQRP